ncbi:MAG: hypothetical protein AB9819_01190 [Methanomassiliicoccales archaeon]
MRVGRALSDWRLIALVSSAAGGLTYLLLSITQNYSPSSLGWFIALTYTWWASFIVCILMTVAPWRPLNFEGTWDPVKLRRAGFEVIVRGEDFDLRVAKFSMTRIRVRGGERYFRTLPTSTGLWVIFLLSFFPFFTVLAFLFLLYIYMQAHEGLRTYGPLLKDISRPTEPSVEELVLDSLTSAYMMARQAVDANRSRFQDHCIIMATMAIIGFGALLLSSVRLPFDADEYAWRLGGGTVLLITITIIGMLALWRRARRMAEEDERWANRLMAVMNGAVPEETSAIELLLRAVSEAPRWLNAHRRAMWYRRPGLTLLIALLLDQGTIFLFIGIGFDLVRLLGGGLFAIGVLLLLDQYRRGRKESELLREEWTRKMQEMENVLGLTGKG